MLTESIFLHGAINTPSISSINHQTKEITLISPPQPRHKINIIEAYWDLTNTTPAQRDQLFIAIVFYDNIKKKKA